MKKNLLLLFVLLINSIFCELYKGTLSECTERSYKENIDGTFACLSEERQIYIPYFELKAYREAIINNDCEKAKELFKKYKRNKRFIECHKKWYVVLK